LYTYFLLNYGKGYTGGFVGEMAFDELNWHVGKVMDDLKERKRLQDQEAQKLKSQARRARRR